MGALIKLADDTYELAKMGVKEIARGKQIGKKLGLAVINKARKLGGKKIVLESNKKLTPALTLYERLGFRAMNTSNDLDQCPVCPFPINRVKAENQTD